MHIATMALGRKLSKESCKECPRSAPCRLNKPLNGHEAAVEFSRGLLPWARALVLKDAGDKS